MNDFYMSFIEISTRAEESYEWTRIFPPFIILGSFLITKLAHRLLLMVSVKLANEMRHCGG